MIIKNDKVIGELAVERGLMSQLQLDECIAAQAHISKVGCHKRLGEIFLEKRVLSSRQMLELLRLQRTRYQQRYFAGYQLHATLGEGGMGRVYWATREKDGLRVALKVLAKDAVSNPGAVERFYRESQVALSLLHPNLIRAYEYGCHRRRYFLALEFVRGWTVAQHLVEQGPMPQARAMLVTRQIAQAITYLADRGIVHRDVKPSNIMLTAHSQAKLLDYGLARQVASSGQRVTLTGQVVGTPDYMAPEQVLGQNVDTRTDLYALGATLYSMVTARAPYEDLEGPNAILMGHLSGKYRNPLDFAPDLRPDVIKIITKSMSIDVEDRYQDPQAFIVDLDRALAGDPVAAAIEAEPALPELELVDRRVVPRTTRARARNRSRTPRRGMTDAADLGAWALVLFGLTLGGTLFALILN